MHYPIIHPLERAARLALLVLAWCLTMAARSAEALDILRLDKSADRTQASIAGGQIIKFRIRYNCASTSDNALSAVIADALAPQLELVSVQGSAHTTDASYDGASHTVRFTFISPLPAGSTGELFIQTRFRSTTPDQTVANNTAVFSAANSDTRASNTVSVTAIDPPSGGGGPPPPPTFVPGLSGQKYGPSSITPQGPYLYYEIAHGNTGDALSPLPNYTIEDPLPAGTSLTYIGTDQWGGTDQPVTVFYRTNLNGAWRQWGAGARYRSGDSRTWIYPEELALPATEWVTALRFSYGNLPGGGAFLPANRSRNLEIVALMRNPATFAAGTTITNCATVSATGYTQTSCVDTQVTASKPQPYLYVNTDGAHYQPYAIGESFLAQAHIGVGNASSSGMDDPVVWVLLPPQVEYAGTWRTRWWATGSANVNPDFRKVDNFRGTGETLLEWSWAKGKPLNIPANRTWNECMVEADVRVRPRTANAYYPIQSWATWRTPALDTGDQSYTNDTRDLDGDGNVTERLAEHSTSVYVETGNGVAGLESTMFVRGELDAAWTKFPSIGQTVAGGKADYELHVKNIGGIVMRDAIIVDILPVTGDTGVIDLTPRGSQWSPFLVDAVKAPAGVTVLYSTSRNPARPELVPTGPPGSDNPQWTSTVPDDITTVRSLKFDMTGLEMYPGDEVILTWPMRAPWGAPTNGEVAWNSFGFVATRADNGESLLASEPVKTGIAIQKPTPPYYGDRVWMDANKNGLQDAGENGINGVRVELFRDNGDNIANPATDTFVAFTVTYTEAAQDGKYLFGNIGPGNYFAVVLAPGETGVSSPDKGADDKDSDGTSIIYRNRRAAIMPVTKLDPLEEDRTWDQGFYSRSGIPAVWSVAALNGGAMFLGGKFAKSHGVSSSNIVKVTARGSVDPTFKLGTGFDNTVRSLAVRGDGVIAAGGNFLKYNGSPSRGIALFSADGKWVNTPAQPDTTEVFWVGASGNQVYLAGTFGKVGGVPCGNFARLNANGTLDTAFNKGSGANATVYGGEVLPDGSLILVGAFSSIHGVSRKGIAKLKPDGSVDPSFNPLGGASGDVYSVKPISDGRLTLTGSFNSFAGVACNGAVRLLKTGGVDPTMRTSPLSVRSINSSN